MSTIRPYERGDLEDVARIWREVGWIDDSERNKQGLETFIGDGADALVGEIAGEAECFVQRAPGQIRYLEDDVSLSLVMAVTTSRIARQRGLATEMTGRLVLDAAAEGAAVAALGMFEQGFYERFGFGTGSYEHRFRLDPTSLRVPPTSRTIVRLTLDHAAELHELMQRTARSHGGVRIDDPTVVAAELQWFDKPIALGIRADDGRLTGAIAGTARSSSHADLEILLAETPDEMIELLGVIKALADQWVTVEFAEPPGIQLVDLIDRPMRQGTKRTHVGTNTFQTARAWWQVRILDLEACLHRVAWHAEPQSLILRVEDPLGPDEPTNLSGDWVVHLGHETSVERGSAADLPVVSAGIGTLSRLWLGVRSATALARSTDLEAPVELLDRLDRGLTLPRPEPGLYF